MKKWVMANWKMHGSKALVQRYISALHKQQVNQNLELVIFPPAIYVPEFDKNAHKINCKLGAQNIYAQPDGAYTGEISAAMIKEYNCQYALIGHSERRLIFGEDEKLIAQKFQLAKDCGIIPVVCIGETLAEYESKKTIDILSRQLKSLKINDAFSLEKSIIAYEPVWAIGTGLTPSSEEIAEVFFEIRKILHDLEQNSSKIPLLYGGSVTLENIEKINNIADGQGVLVGGASLKIEQLLEITQCIVC